MNARRNKLLSAIKNAERHVNSKDKSGSLSKHQDSRSQVQPRSKLARMTGKTELALNRKPLLARVGVKNRPTYDLLADGVLGQESENYQPKISVGDSNNDVSTLVAQRLKNLRERTLNKISSDANMSENTFFGFESDGTPIWSSVVSGAREIDDKQHHLSEPPASITHHHSTHIPVVVDWPKELPFSTHNTFKTWCTVSENKRATQLAEQVVDFTQQSLNPLIIIGDSGTGKSHLLNAIGQSILLRADQTVFFVRGKELPKELSNNLSWTDVFAHASVLLIDDIDEHLVDDDVMNHIGRMVDTALNLNIHVVVTCTNSVDNWPASKIWDLLRSGVKTMLNPVGAGSLLLYARRLAMQKSIVLSDEQLALLVTSGEVGWRNTKNAMDKVESAINHGAQLIDSIDVYKLINDIQSDEEEVAAELASESVEDIATRLINSVVDVVYSDNHLGGIEINSELPELSDDYEPPELDIAALSEVETDFVESHIRTTLDDLTPEAPSVIDINDRDKHLVAKMTRIIQKDHTLAADILTELDVGIDNKIDQSNQTISAETEQLVDLEARLLDLANRTSDASMEGLIGIADELRALEHELVTIDPNRGELPEFLDDDITDTLESFVPDGEWDVNESQVSVDDLLIDESVKIPIEGFLEPHPEGVKQTSTLTPVAVVLSGEEE